MGNSALDEAYYERNQLVALLARLFPSGLRKTDIEGWDAAWHNCVFIDLPTGQVSWHFHDREAHLFEGLPPYTKEWDGHSTPEKYLRVAAAYRRLVSPPAPAAIDPADLNRPVNRFEQQAERIRAREACTSLTTPDPDCPKHGAVSRG